MSTNTERRDFLKAAAVIGMELAGEWHRRDHSTDGAGSNRKQRCEADGT
jgi:hypothetical protein